MATEPIIYLDFDGVLANFYDNFMAITGADYPHLSRGLADAHWQTYVSHPGRSYGRFRNKCGCV